MPKNQMTKASLQCRSGLQVTQLDLGLTRQPQLLFSAAQALSPFPRFKNSTSCLGKPLNSETRLKPYARRAGACVKSPNLPNSLAITTTPHPPEMKTEITHMASAFQKPKGWLPFYRATHKQAIPPLSHGHGARKGYLFINSKATWLHPGSLPPQTGPQGCAVIGGSEAKG